MIKGVVLRDGTGVVYIDEQQLEPGPSLKLVNHSPTGFSWGYSGSGPAQLALAILLHFASEEFALNNYQQFKFDIIANLPQHEAFALPEKAVHKWIEAHL